MNPEYESLVFGLILIHGLLVGFAVGYYLIYRALRRGHAQRVSWRRRLIGSILLPVNFAAIFLHKRKEAHLPLYFRWFLRFTRFCSKVPYFHFLPKFIVATLSEIFIYFFTGQELLTGLVFVWSMSFFILISFVESNLGELEEESITLANKIFLYSVSILTLVTLIIGNFFWDSVQPFFDNGFWHFVAWIAQIFNDLLIEGFYFFVRHPWAIVVAVVLLIIYISSSLFLSEYLKRKE